MKSYNLLGIDLPDDDIINLQNLIKKTKECEVIIHLALTNGDFNNQNIFLGDMFMTYIVYKATTKNKVKRLIMASSVHADKYQGKRGLLVTTQVPTPDSDYGASKVYLESLGELFAHQEVVCIRLAGRTKKIKKECRKRLL